MKAAKMKRRTFLLAIVLLSVVDARAQGKPKLIVLGRGITSPMKSLNPTLRQSEISLESWLVCNGAEASRDAYAELFSLVGVREGAGDGISTFNLPTLELEMRKEGSEVVRGWAICPRSSRDSSVGELMPFDVESNI
jgi:hypothetical protein